MVMNVHRPRHFILKIHLLLFKMDIRPPMKGAMCGIRHEETTPERWWLFRSWRGVNLPHPHHHRGAPELIQPFFKRWRALKMQSMEPPCEWLHPRLPFHSPALCKGWIIKPSSGGEYLHVAVALYSSLAATDHNQLCTVLWGCDTRDWRNSRGVRKSIIWNFCFFFLRDSMLLFSCHLVPFSRIYCFEGFVSDSSFLLLVLSLLLPCFCLRGRPYPPLLVLCVGSLVPFCHAAICFTFLSPSALLYPGTQKQILFLSAFFCMVLRGCHFPFRIGTLYCMCYSFWFQESHTRVQRSAKADDSKKHPSFFESNSLRTVQTCSFPVDQLT